MEESMRVAFTSSDGSKVDEHFGQATHFHVWEVGPSSAEPVAIVGAFGAAAREAEEAGSARRRGEGEARAIDALRGPSFIRPPQQDDEDDRIAARAEAIAGCALVYTLRIGGPAAAKLVARHIHPMKTGAEVPIAAAVAQLQQVLRGRPPPWLRKAMGLAPDPTPAPDPEDA
jgi:nitrogen fixation protein NifX